MAILRRKNETPNRGFTFMQRETIFSSLRIMKNTLTQEQLDELMIDWKAHEWLHKNFRSMEGLYRAVKTRHCQARQFVYHAFFSKTRTPELPRTFSERKRSYREFFKSFHGPPSI